MSVHVLLNLLNKLRKKDKKCEVCRVFYRFFATSLIMRFQSNFNVI